MKKNVFSLLIAVLLIIPSNMLMAQEDEAFSPTFGWSGFTHIWTGYVQRDSLDGHYGFVPRYLRFKAFGSLTPDVKYTAQFGFDRGNPALLDIYLSYEPFTFFKVRFGQFGVPGIKSGVMTSSIWSTTKLVLNDRSTITQNWNSNAGLSGYRSGGLMAYGGFLEDMIKYYAMISMPQAGPNYYWSPSVKNPVYENDQNGLALFSRLEFSPIKNTEIGASFHTGSGISEDTIKTNRMSYSVFALIRQKKLYAMAEYVSGTNEQLYNDVQASEFSYSGFFVEAAYKFTSKLEPALRFDNYVPIKDGNDGSGYKSYSNITVGLNFYPTSNIAIMANYVARMEDPDAATGASEIKNDLIYFQLRYKFKSK